MTLAPTETESGPDKCHKGADQWLFVVSGVGIAIVESEHVELREASITRCECISCAE